MRTKKSVKFAYMFDKILTILTLGLKTLYEKNSDYAKLVSEFRKKLPRAQNRAKNLTPDEKKKYGLDKGLAGRINVLNLAAHKTSLTEQDIDLFYNSLDNFNYRFVFFKDYFKSYTNNLKRFSPTATNKDFDLAVLQLVLEDSLHPLKPIPVLTYHLKWKYKWSSKIYRLFTKRKGLVNGG